MPLKLTPPVEQTFHLEETDRNFEVEGSPTTVTIRQASQEQKERRFDLFATITQKFRPGDDEVEISQRFSPPELMRMEVYLTMVGCNITDANGKELFKFATTRNGRTILDMTEKEFKLAWGELHDVVANEIHAKVLEVNPTWRRDANSGEA